MIQKTQTSEMQKTFADFFSACPENVMLFAKGRTGLYAVLKAMGLGPGDEIIVPGYTCMVVPSAARFLNICCRYVDIDPLTYNINPVLLDSCLSRKTKALIVQHTYGIPADMDPIMQWAQKKNIAVIEDCCHVFGSRYRGRLCGTFGAASFFSGQWNKPFSTGLGGMLLINDRRLLPELQNICAMAEDVSFVENMRLKMQIAAYNAFVTPRTNAMMTNAYRFFSRMGITAGSSTNEELAGKMPPGYLKKMAPAQMQEGAANLCHIEDSIEARKTNTGLYTGMLQRTPYKPLMLDSHQESFILRYPVRVANKKECLRLAAQRRFEIGSWFEVPLHPEGTDMEALGYLEGMCPEAEKASREVINLPTHLKITPREAERIIHFLCRHAQPA